MTRRAEGGSGAEGGGSQRFVSRHHGPQPAGWFLREVETHQGARWIVCEPDAHAHGYECHVGAFPLGPGAGAHAREPATLARMGATLFESPERARRALCAHYQTAEDAEAQERRRRGKA